MGNLDFSANADQLKELTTYMASQINVPTIGIGGGYAPIGAIQFFDATTAPQDWLACDGTVYNIADYPQLADWYEAQHGSKNFYGGDGTTTFAVPDLQGEFLRGTGTNSHANQGSGANVGVHQDGTVLPLCFASENSRNVSLSDWVETTNPDYSFTTEGATFTASERTSNGRSYSSRPTNTSFLICVKAVVAGEVYSTEEREVGTWIDGKPLYQKTFANLLTTPIIPSSAGKTIHNLIDLSSLNISDMASLNGILTVNGNSRQPIPMVDGVEYTFALLYTRKDGDANDKWLRAKVKAAAADVSFNALSVTIQYTKTTD